jgi:hypothetical protein
MQVIYRIGKKKVLLKTLDEYEISFTGVNLYEMPKAEHIDFYFNVEEEFEQGLDGLFDLVEKSNKKNKDVFFEVASTENVFEFYGKPILWGVCNNFCNIRISING